MNDNYFRHRARENFYKLRKQAFLRSILSILNPRKNDLLALDDVRKLLKPHNETYQGIQTVPVRLIVGSEGRYKDFSKEFLPRYDHLESRWTNIDSLQLQDIILPPVQLYEIGGVYFVRDGNHRVSVARSQGIEDIDAEVVKIDSIVPISPEMDREELKKAVIEYEKLHFEEKTNFHNILPPDYPVRFTTTGRYKELLLHIYEHKYFINLEKNYEISLEEAIRSWFDTVYKPIIDLIRKSGHLANFPDRSESDLFIWVCKRWHILKERYGASVEMRQAADEVTLSKGQSPIKRLQNFWKNFITKHWLQ